MLSRAIGCVSGMRSLRTRPWRSAHQCAWSVASAARWARKPPGTQREAPSRACWRSGGSSSPIPTAAWPTGSTGNFAAVFNECDFDMVYFDASDGTLDAYLDNWYYQNKLHLGFYRKFKKDVLYQTSCGTGTGLVWHIVPRSASADGHGDLKRYLDERLPGMLGMEANFTRPNVGWYYMYTDVRPDQIEYVCAKTIGLDGSISIEDFAGRHGEAPPGPANDGDAGPLRRDAGWPASFPKTCRQFYGSRPRTSKLLRNGAGWRLYRAVYEDPRYVETLDGRQNVWTITNERSEAVPLCVEIACGFRKVPTADYDQPGTQTIDSFDDTAPYRRKRAQPAEAVLRRGRVGRHARRRRASRGGVEMSFHPSAETPRVGERCEVWLPEHGPVGRMVRAPSAAS